MSLANDSFVRTPDGGGTSIALETQGGKSHSLVMQAGSQGHIKGTRDSYLVIGPATGGSVVGANKAHLEIWNGSTQTMFVHGIWVMNDFDVAIAGTLAVRVDLVRASAQATGGTLLTYNTATTATRTVIPIVPGAPDPLAAGVAIREAPTGGTASTFIGQWYTMPEEAATSQGYLTQFANGIRYAQLEDMSDLVVPGAGSGFNQGLRIVQGPVASVGRVGYRVAFTLV